MTNARKIIAVIDTNTTGNMGIIRKFIASAPDARKEAERVAASQNRDFGYARFAVREMADPSRLPIRG